ncbi:hypothetical protein P175DRAFT_0490975 [Aspergillus ochraceoroseus IBT 24754]|uniref:Uncharacterized protein n=1 Tax=Aspergillus ochraceoroseus IBT 24754 TaxID=1392256 RepID=A0A2T5M1W9_9EURO|nr:uncharacterized protein P175DRAFT_0490975 [Aspergillus ochraceoroseus IBT 24754]PTU22518.1 hypothetical protein P175DRAFT_0490975 [Aspergillus ochraceoroseus IBT 24754]
MLPSSTWTNLLLLLSTSVFIFISLSTSLPTPATNLRSRSPDPRMIPSHTDLLSTLLANTSLEKLDEYNHLGSHGSNTNSNNVHGAIDDSNSNNSTVTAKDNAVESGKDPVDDPVGFMNSLFESLRKNFREVLDDGDEVLL